jgi:SlyX protein
MKDDRLAVLEEKLAWLQRHVAEQDKAMLEMAAEIDRLKKRASELGDKLAGIQASHPPAKNARRITNGRDSAAGRNIRG